MENRHSRRRHGFRARHFRRRHRSRIDPTKAPTGRLHAFVRAVVVVVVVVIVHPQTQRFSSF